MSESEASMKTGAIGSDPNMLEFTVSKISKPSFRVIRNTLKSYSSRFNHLHEDNDLKQMTSVQAQEILFWFNEEAFGVPRSSMLDNFSAQFYHDEGLPLPDKVENAITLVNSNLLAYKGLA